MDSLAPTSTPSVIHVLLDYCATSLLLFCDLQVDLGMIPCDVCDYRAVLPSKLAVHKETHRADRPYRCDICFKVSLLPRSNMTG